jgi:hypothetical protein
LRETALVQICPRYLTEDQTDQSQDHLENQVRGLPQMQEVRHMGEARSLAPVEKPDAKANKRETEGAFNPP